MEKIVYRKTLDVHKHGTQFLLSGFETADKVSRQIVINLMASGDAIDLPMDQIEAVIYIFTPGIAEPSINKCLIDGNNIIYDVLPITKEGITTMQLKLISTKNGKADGVLFTPKFAVEVLQSEDKNDVTPKPTFTAVEKALAVASEAYGKRVTRVVLNDDLMFYVYYADGTIYSSDAFKKIYTDGEVLLAQSFAVGESGVRDGEWSDNARYYSDIAKSMSAEVKQSGEDALKTLDEVKLHGVYTIFDMNWETGELVYESPKYNFSIDKENGNLQVDGKSYNLEDTLRDIVSEYLKNNGIVFPEFMTSLNEFKGIVTKLNGDITAVNTDLTRLESNKVAVCDYAHGAFKDLKSSGHSQGDSNFVVNWTTDRDCWIFAHMFEGPAYYKPYLEVDGMRFEVNSSSTEHRSLSLFVKKGTKITMSGEVALTAYNVVGYEEKEEEQI